MLMKTDTIRVALPGYRRTETHLVAAGKKRTGSRTGGDDSGSGGDKENVKITI
jgi:hypothetical protein